MNNAIVKLKSNNFNKVVARAVAVLKGGGIIIAPFDTVYGFLADAKNDEAISKIYKLKSRSPSKPLGLVVFDFDSIKAIAEIGWREAFIKSKIPGKYTFLLNLRCDTLISPFCQSGGRVGLRVPGSRLILEIANGFDRPLTQTSANKAGQPDCAAIKEIRKQFIPEELSEIDLMIDGGWIPAARPSEIFDLTGAAIKRIER